MLIEEGANVNVVDERNRTPLHYIALRDSIHYGHQNWTEDDILSNFHFICALERSFIFRPVYEMLID